MIPYHSCSTEPGNRMSVAAVQMHAVLGDVETNLKTAERLVEDAAEQGPKAVVLPEFFTSGLGYHPSMMHAHRPLDGAPMRMLKGLSRKHAIWLGGSFLAESGGHVYNTFVLALPDGRVFTHDKDFPTADVEQLLYAPGEDAEFLRLLRNPTRTEVIPSREGNNFSGVSDIGEFRVGNAMCWELVRKRTDRRILAAKADIVLAASGWWYFAEPEEASDVYGRSVPYWREQKERNHRELKEAPIRLARMVGAPVVHANLVGQNESYLFPTGERTICREFQGESQVVDIGGEVVARRSPNQGEGIVIGQVSVGHREPEMKVGDGFWHIRQGDLASLDWWYDGYGRDYYLTVTQPQRKLYVKSRKTSDK